MSAPVQAAIPKYSVVEVRPLRSDDGCAYLSGKRGVVTGVRLYDTTDLPQYTVQFVELPGVPNAQFWPNELTLIARPLRFDDCTVDAGLLKAAQDFLAMRDAGSLVGEAAAVASLRVIVARISQGERL